MQKMRKNRRKRSLAAILAAAMVFTTVPADVRAEASAGTADVQAEAYAGNANLPALVSADGEMDAYRPICTGHELRCAG